MPSLNGSIFRVTGPLCGEFTGPGEFPAQRPATRSFDVFFDLRLNKRLSKQPRGWWFEMPSWSLWPHRNDVIKVSRYCPWSISYIHYVPWIWRPFCCAFIVVVFSVLVVFVRQVPYSHTPYFLGLLHWLLNRHKPLAKCIGSDGISRSAKICDWQPYLYQETIKCYETSFFYVTWLSKLSVVLGKL